MIRAQASQTVGAGMVNATTGAAFTGTVTVYVTIDGGTQAIGTVGSGVCTAEGNGYFTYNPSAAETDGYLVAFTFTGTGAIPVTIQFTTITLAQQAALVAAVSSTALTVRDLIQECFEDCTILSAGETLTETDAQFALKKLTRLFDNMNAERVGVYAERFASYTLVPALQPHTIGPTASSPTFTVTQRPVSIESANLVISDVRHPLTIHRDAQWWASLALPELSTDIPTDLWYSADWPLGRLYLYPVPAAAYEIELFTRVLLASLAIDDTLSLPPGYRDAVTLTLGEMIVQAYPTGIAQPERAAEARARIYRNNDVTPSLATRDSGMPGSRRTTFSWRKGY